MGPRGMGPMTGRGAGYCAGYPVPGYLNPASGRGAGMGGRGGFGRGWRHMFFATGQPGWMRFGAGAAPFQASDPETEKQTLKAQADQMQRELDSIRQRLEELDRNPAQP